MWALKVLQGTVSKPGVVLLVVFADGKGCHAPSHLLIEIKLKFIKEIRKCLPKLN